MEKDAYYFSHDSNARNDHKILKLRRILGLEGYGIYFCLVEMLREHKDFKLPMSDLLDFAYNLNVSEEKLKSVITSFDLFEIDENQFFSPRLLASMDKYKSISKKRIAAGRKGGQAKGKQMLTKRKPKALPLLNVCSSIKGKESKVKESKIKEKKKCYNTEYVYFTDEESRKLIDRFGSSGAQQRAEDLDLYAQKIGIKKFKAKYDSHYHTILSWERKNGSTQPKRFDEEGFEEKEEDMCEKINRMCKEDEGK